MIYDVPTKDSERASPFYGLAWRIAAPSATFFLVYGLRTWLSPISVAHSCSKPFAEKNMQNDIILKYTPIFPIVQLVGPIILAYETMWEDMEEEPIEIIHFHSDGKQAPGLHLSKSDFAASLNRTAVCAAEFPDVTIVAFDIEDTHFHFVLKCRRSRGWLMIALFTKMTHRYLSETRDDGSFDGKVVFSEDIVDTDDYCQNVCAYTVIQPTKDGQQIMPFDYPWGSGPLYFRSEKVIPVWLVDRDGKVQTPMAMGSLTSRMRKKWFHTQKSLPGNWLVCNGLILPSNYVDVKLCESIFGTYNNYRYCLARANADEVKRRMARARGVSLPDIEMRRVCMEKCFQVFHKKMVRELNSMERLELARLLRKQYVISHAQLSRLVHMPLEEIERYI